MNKKAIGISELEQTFIDQEKPFIIGVDEAGTGSLMGGVTACACLLDYHNLPSNIKDSKFYSSESQREEVFEEIKKKSVHFIYSLNIKTINELKDMNIVSYYARYKAIEGLVWELFKKSIMPHVIMIDRFTLREVIFDEETGKVKELLDKSPTLKELLPNVEVYGVENGDSTVLSIAAASVLAKVSRDREVLKYDKMFPEYNFKSNKGYGTKDHVTAIKKCGITKLHRDWYGICKDAPIMRPDAIPEDIINETVDMAPKAQKQMIQAYQSFNGLKN